MSQTMPKPPVKPRRSLLQRVPRWMLWTVVILGVFVFPGWFVVWQLSSSRLEQARAEADRLDSGWRWDEIQAKRARYPDAGEPGGRWG
jgi:hypothetical protein